MKTKRSRLSVIVLSVFVMGLFSFSFIGEAVGGINDLDFTFVNDTLYNSTIPYYNSTYNKRNPEVYSKDYDATYSFTDNNEGDFGLDIDWVADMGTDYNHTVINSTINGHDKILSFFDDDGSSQVYHVYDGSFIAGEVEFWASLNDASKYFRLYFSDSGTNNFYIRFNVDKIYVDTIPVLDISDNIWYHLKVVWYVDNTWDLYINGFLESNGRAMTNNMVDGIDRNYIVGYSSDNTKFLYIDGWGESWDSYNATYSFTDEANGDNPSGWICDEGGGSIDIINNIDEHYKVIHLNDSDNGDDLIVSNGINEVSEGTIEMWIRLDSNYLYLELKGDGSRISWFLFSSGQIYCEGGNFTGYAGATQGFDNWFHYKVYFNYDLDLTKHYINGIHRIDLTYKSLKTLDDFRLYTHTVELTNAYLDGIGYSWDPYYNIGDNLERYSIGDNIVPLYEVNSSILEVDKWEFDYEAFNDLSDVGDDDVNSWSDVEIGANDLVNIANDYGYFDREIKIDHNHIYDGEMGFEREFDVESGLINISWSLTPYYMNDEGANFSTRILSYDDTAIIDIYLELDSVIKLYYYDGSDLVLLKSGLLEFTTIYDFNLFIDFSSDTWVLRYLVNGTFNEQYFGSLYNTGKDGLGKVSFISYDVGGSYDQKFYIHNVGVYINGSSLSSEFAYLQIKSNIWAWNLRTHNLFSFFGKGNLSFRLTTLNYIPEVSTFVVLKSLVDYNGSDVLYNVYDKNYYGDYYYDFPNIFITLYNSIELSDISIDGVNLIEGSNEYALEYSHGNIDIDNNYFFVDSNNRLQFTLTVNDNDTEYIQAIFNINDLPSENRSISFSSNINGEAKGFLFIDYNDATSVSLEFPYYTATTSAILVQTKVIDKFTIIITDNDLDDNDFCSGYITDIELIYNPDIHITITTLTLLAVIVPLIVMIVPSVAMKKKFGVMGVMATFILMAVICVLTSLIPIWLFFVIVLGLLGFFVMKKKVEGDS